ncbi:hypothetical protein ACLI4R_19075 [Natrialbaceae archaeon A-chndr2]
MGLDTYWTPNGSLPGTEDPIVLEFDPPLFPDAYVFDDGWFRAQEYAELLFAVTETSLYVPTIPNHQIHEMAAELEATPYEEAARHRESAPTNSKSALTRREYEDLRRMFRAYADAGSQLETSF